ncbi:MAG: tRNA lysidine(34) synthetase TilS [Muribaculaceae bacterium]|nr:tRNA lysidine(34) synthetase TilS [Muribaculaceae bacterium]
MSNSAHTSVISRFERAVSDFIRAGHLLRKGAGAAPVLVGLSGGADSVALLLVLRALGYDVRAAHCNFHLRGAESMRDMHFVEQLCASHDIELYVRDFDVPARRSATGESVEMACRSLRYAWFASLLDREYAQALAVGHHREDQAETLLLNLFRGTGPAGLAGMRPRRTDGPGGLTIVRPLLECSRAQIEEYLHARGTQWIVDSSNDGDDYVRNRIRHRLLPAFDDITPGAMDGLLRTSAQVADAMDLYSGLVDSLRSRFILAGRIDLAAFTAELGPLARMALWEMLRPMGFNMTQIRNILEAYATGASGLSFTAAGRTAELSRGILDLNSRGAAPLAHSESSGPVSVDLRRDVIVPLRIAVSHRPVNEFPSEPMPPAPSVAFIDTEAALTGRWELRHWRHGDRMTPFGMKGSKLVSDIFALAKLDARAKREAWLLVCNGEIVWIPGIKRSALHTVGPGSKRFTRLEIDLK